MSPARALRAAALLLLLAPARAAAQMAEPPPGGAPRGGEVDLSGFVGVLTPLARLAEDAATSTFAEVSTSVGLGAALEYVLPGGLGFGAWGVWVPADVAVTRSDPNSGLPATGSLDGSDYLAAVAGLLYRPTFAGSRAVLRPFVSLGAGVRRLSLGGGSDAQDAGFDFSVVNEATDLVGAAAAGVDVDFSPAVALRFEVRDLVSDYESEALGQSTLQNDVTVSVGIMGRLR